MNREYKVFKDEVGKAYVLWVDIIKICVFSGSVGKLTEVENGFFKRDKNQLSNIMSVMNRYE